VDFLEDADVMAAMLAEDESIFEGLYGDDELEELLGDLLKGEEVEDPGARINEADALAEKWGVCVGQVWELAEHRLAVGDCTDPQVVEAVMRGERAQLAVLDPPYNIGKAEWDTRENYQGWFLQWNETFCNDLMDKGSIYVFGWPEILAPLFGEYPLENKRLLVWHYENKNTPNQRTWGRSFELIIYAWKGKPVFNKDAGRVPYHSSSYERAKYGGLTDGWGNSGKPLHLHPGGAQPRDVLIYPVLSAGRGQVERVAHPTQKPLDLIETLVGVSSNEGDLVFDGFVGSGTTIAACETLGRKVRAVELDPGYAAVAIQRMADMGLEPHLLA